MAYYEELNPILKNIIGEKFLRNQKLCKLLYYYPKDADLDIDNFSNFDYSVFSQPDIEDTNKLYMRHIYPLPKMPDAKTKQRVYMTVTFSGGYDMDINTGYRRITLVIDIISHLNIWCVKEGYRPLLIMAEIDKMLNNQLTDLPIENKPISRGFQPRDYSNYFYGVQMLYTLYVNSNIQCPVLPQNINISSDEPDIPIERPNFLPKNLGFK